MKVNKSVILFISIGLLLILLFILKDIFYYKAANEVNKNLKADGFKVMMDIEEVRKVCGKEEIFNQGFGGDFLEYPSKGVVFSVSTDSDYDLYNKIGDLRIRNPEYSLFEIQVGLELSRASEILRSKGYKESISTYGERSYTKGCVYIDFSNDKKKIYEIRIIVKDKNYDPNRVY